MESPKEKGRNRKLFENNNGQDLRDTANPKTYKAEQTLSTRNMNKTTLYWAPWQFQWLRIRLPKAGDISLTPGPGRFYVSQGNEACGSHQREPARSRASARQQEREATAVRSPSTASSHCSLQLEKACTATKTQSSPKKSKQVKMLLIIKEIGKFLKDTTLHYKPNNLNSQQPLEEKACITEE